MLVIGRRVFLAVFFLLMPALSAGLFYYFYRPGIKIGNHVLKLNTRAGINPKKQYALRIWEYQWPVSDGRNDYGTYLREAVHKFQILYPQVKVEIKYLDMLEGPAEVSQALERNEGPDLYCSNYAIPEFDFRRQIPVGPFLSAKEKRAFLPSATASCSLDGILCLFPRWTSPGVWIGNRALLEEAGFNPDTVREHGWTWREFADGASRLPAGINALSGNPGYSGFLTQLATTGGCGFNEGSPAACDGLKRALDFLGGLIDAGRIVKNPGQDFLSPFMQGRAMVLAGARPLYFKPLSEKSRRTGAGFETILLPVPIRNKKSPGIPWDYGVICVYRNRRTRGDDHIAAAVKLGYFLSTYRESWPWEKLMFYPAALESAERWEKKAGLSSEDCAVVRNAAYNGVKSHSWTGEKYYQDAVYPLLLRFCRGEIGREEFLTDLRSQLSLTLPFPMGKGYFPAIVAFR
ncbi:MAG: hypothetical protein ACM3WV_12040 [Bacillota bacterium]